MAAEFIPLEERRQAAALANLGEDIALWRKIRRLSRQQLAAQTGISVSTLARLEKGDAGVSVGALVKAARVLKIPDFLDRASPFESAEGQRLIAAYKGLV